MISNQKLLSTKRFSASNNSEKEEDGRPGISSNRLKDLQLFITLIYHNEHNMDVNELNMQLSLKYKEII